ncbi:MAG: HAMP domain-containing histidine kinase [Blautia sp.]|nr:HAMP domain-containing histidine kinase [Blautia sp.]
MNEERRQFWKNAGITFFTTFVTNAFVITASFFLFFHSIELDEAQVPKAAITTFGNVILLTLFFLCVHLIRNYLTVTKPVRKIKKGLDEITNGNLNIRIEPDGANPAFDSIIDSINRMTEELSSVETLKTDFLSNVSHEIRTPIAVIQNYSRLLQTDSLTDDQRKEYSKTVSDAAVRLAGLISNILKLNRLENQQIKLNTEQFDLGGHLTECLLGFENVWEEKEIEIEPDIADDVMIRSDRELLSLVWNNLLSNAFKFTEPGGIVRVLLKTEDEAAVVSIQDTGCGMDAATGRHIFDKFYQGDTSRATQGNGLGLALVKRVIDLTDGEISVKSTLGEGSTFTVKLPVSHDA